MTDQMTDQHQVEILLVEDNPTDAELTLRAFKARNFANQVFVARDGAEALDFFFGDGSHPLRNIGVVPKVVLSSRTSARAPSPSLSSPRRAKSPTSPPRTGSAPTATSSSRWTSRRSHGRCRRSGSTGCCSTSRRAERGRAWTFPLGRCRTGTPPCRKNALLWNDLPTHLLRPRDVPRPGQLAAR